jgi:hypothetical protein
MYFFTLTEAAAPDKLPLVTISAQYRGKEIP